MTKCSCCGDRKVKRSKQIPKDYECYCDSCFQSQVLPFLVLERVRKELNSLELYTDRKPEKGREMNVILLYEEARKFFDVLRILDKFFDRKGELMEELRASMAVK